MKRLLIGLLAFLSPFSIAANPHIEDFFDSRNIPAHELNMSYSEIGELSDQSSSIINRVAKQESISPQDIESAALKVCLGTSLEGSKYYTLTKETQQKIQSIARDNIFRAFLRFKLNPHQYKAYSELSEEQVKQLKFFKNMLMLSVRISEKQDYANRKAKILNKLRRNVQSSPNYKPVVDQEMINLSHEKGYSPSELINNNQLKKEIYEKACDMVLDRELKLIGFPEGLADIPELDESDQKMLEIVRKMDR